MKGILKIKTWGKKTVFDQDSEVFVWFFDFCFKIEWLVILLVCC